MNPVIEIDKLPPKESECGPVREVWQEEHGAFDVAHLSVQPGRHTETHWHERHREIYIVASGSAVVSLDGEAFDAVAPGAIEIPPGRHHQLRNDGPNPIELYVLCAPAFDPADVHLEAAGG